MNTLKTDFHYEEFMKDSKNREAFQYAMFLGRKFFFEERHGLQVSAIATTLFDQLARIHHLGQDDRLFLMIGSLLHDIGSYVDYDNHHKHSRDIITESKFPLLSKDERAVVANIARYHRKAEPQMKHEAFASLGKKFRDKVVKLCSITRVADALDREHVQKVKKINTSIERNSLILRIESPQRLVSEELALAKKVGLFSRVFELKVKIQHVRI